MLEKRPRIPGIDKSHEDYKVNLAEEEYYQNLLDVLGIDRVNPDEKIVYLGLSLIPRNTVTKRIFSLEYKKQQVF